MTHNRGAEQHRGRCKQALLDCIVHGVWSRGTSGPCEAARLDHSFHFRFAFASFQCYKKNIYDVSESPLYKFGIHFNHEAGCDLTDFLADAPHFEEVLDKFPIIGELI